MSTAPLTRAAHETMTPGHGAGMHHGRQPDRMVVRQRPWRVRAMEMLVGIALVVIAAIEIGWIVRTVQANLPRA